MKIKFRKGNKIRYGQDFSFCRGIPHDVIFEVVSEGGLTKLRADGYGNKTNYGNGAIYVEKRVIQKKKDVSQ